MTTVEASHDDSQGHHEHPAWLAHHFDDAEQQYDAGKLGMWLFLVTEVLFFSGMFCAYSLYRNRNPEVFHFCSAFLNEKLGAINTGVLLFSSLTMAWAVRAAQLKQHRLLVGMLGATLGCAAIFLGVKAVEYTHKWELGLLPGRYYQSQLNHEHVSDGMYLRYVCVLPGILLAAFIVYYVMSLLKRNTFHIRIAGPLTVAALCFFGGVGLGQILQAEEPKHGDSGGAHATEGHADKASKNAGHDHNAHAGTIDHHDHGALALVSTTNDVKVDPVYVHTPSPDVNQKGMAGLFFSIYYCMTGVHAVHILGGMVVITWLIVKASGEQFHAQYFGPVDNDGLYWHLVDFIWIYLFPLLYLIT